jgi:hypothetical protein
MPDRFPLRTTAVLLSMAVASTASHAADFCVDTSNELQQALMTAGNNGESDAIKIQIGVYEATSTIAFAYNSAQNFAVSVSGGYLSGCGVQILEPSLTELSGSDERQVVQLSGSAGTSGAQSISNLTISHGFTSQPGAGLKIGGGGGYAGNVSVSRLVLSRNVSTTFGGGMSIASEGIVNVLNNLFLLNRCGDRDCALTATVNAASPVGFRAYFGNNTIVGNQCAQGMPCTFTGARYGGSASSVFYNNVFAANAAGDLNLFNFDGGSTELYNNNVVSISGTPPALMAGNIAFANPQFVDLLNEDLRPTYGSPLRNAGTEAFALLHDDLGGEERVNEFVVDIGAYENHDRMFTDGFEFQE